jgi:hypothetical protein
MKKEKDGERDNYVEREKKRKIVIDNYRERDKKRER